MDTHPKRPPQRLSSSMHLFLTAFCLYGLWGALAWRSHTLGQTQVPRDLAWILLFGIVATNFLFLVVARARPAHQPPIATIMLAQCVLGTVWVTLYTYLSSGAGELALGMYLTTVLFALFRIGHKSFLHLATFASASYATVHVVKRLLDPGDAYWPESIQLLIFLGIIVWLMKFANRPRTEVDLHARAESDYSAKSYNQRYIMESLAREKGRTDRSNTPFSICIFDIDRFSALTEEHGAIVGDRVLKEFSKRVRGELRAMDTINPTGIERTLERFSQQEFVAILPHTSLAGATRCAERIREAVGKTPFDHAHTLTISGGMAEYRRGENISDLLARAEQTLRQAIREGGDRIHGHAPEHSEPAQILELHKLKH